MEREKRKVGINKLMADDGLAFKNSLPFQENMFMKLFDFVDRKLSNENCNHDFRFASEFCATEKLDKNMLMNWLIEQGQGCDCEILNLEDAFQHLNQFGENPVKQVKFNSQKLNNLQTDFGFSIDKIAAPWVLTETSIKGKISYTFQIGKGKNCLVHIKQQFPKEQFDSDKYWLDIWIKETELNYHIEDLKVERQEIGNYYCIAVKSKNWIPVFIWFRHKTTDKWFIKMVTESPRYKGDIKEFEKVLNTIRNLDDGL